MVKLGDGGGGGMTIRGGSGGDAGITMGRGVMKGPGGGPYIFLGPARGPVGEPPNPSQMQKTMLDNTSPETRAGMYYQRGLVPKEPGRRSGGK